MALRRDHDPVQVVAGLGERDPPKRGEADYGVIRVDGAKRTVVVGIGSQRSFDDLLRLPGVGIYIASAVRVFSFGKKDFPIDSNAFRFVSRYFGVTLHIKKSEARQLREFMTPLIPSERPREYVYGFLDFAATICRPREPRCKCCPLLRSCKSQS